MRASVLTPTVTGRELLLDEAMASVAAQTLPAHEHLVRLDSTGDGPAGVRNSLVARAEGDWVLFLDDDDLLDPDFLEVLSPHLDCADVVYPWCRVEGRTDWCPNRLFEPLALQRLNFIPVTALVRKTAFVGVGGFDTTLETLEDWDLWKRLLEHGARFRCVPEVLWTYRVAVAETSRNRWKEAA